MYAGLFLLALGGARADTVSDDGVGPGVDTVFRGKMAVDKGMWSSGRITLTDAAIVIETHHFPFRQDTAGIEYDRVHGDFRTSRGLFRGEVTIGEMDGNPVVFLCPARTTKHLTEALKSRLLAVAPS